MNTYWLSKVGALISGLGIVWAVYIATQGLELSDYLDVILSSAIFKVMLSPGPVEVIGAGILVWLFAKWKATIDIRRQ